MKAFAVMAAVVLLAACSPTNNTDDPTKLDDPARFACDDFAKGWKADQDPVELARVVNEWAPKSITNRIADLGEDLARAATASPDAWQRAADAFAQACLDAQE